MLNPEELKFQVRLAYILEILVKDEIAKANAFMTGEVLDFLEFSGVYLGRSVCLGGVV